MKWESGPVGSFYVDAITIQGSVHSDGTLLTVDGDDACRVRVRPITNTDLGKMTVTGGLIGKPEDGGTSVSPLVIEPWISFFYDFFSEEELILPLEEPGTLEFSTSGGALPKFGPVSVTSPNEPLASSPIEMIHPINLAPDGLLRIPNSQSFTFQWEAPASHPGGKLLVTIWGMGNPFGTKTADLSCAFDPDAKEGVLPLELLEATEQALESALFGGFMKIEVATREILTDSTFLSVEFEVRSALSTTFEDATIIFE